MARGGTVGLLGLGLALAAVSSASAATLQRVGASNYDNPTYVTSDPGNPDRLFVTELEGTIRVSSASGTADFLDLADKVEASGEQGLFSMAFAPDFFQSGLFYVAYTAEGGGALTLDEYREAATPAATEATRRPVASIPSPENSNHNGGQLQFGPDGLLYWSTGDDAVGANAQNTGSLLGKILRLDPRQVPAQPEIWALGLRNPWRFSFDRATGTAYIADVGESTWEEVNVGVPGADYGWNDCEGFEDLAGDCSSPGLTAPIYAYSHTPSAENCAIAGGYVVRDPDLGDLFGRYLFTDLCGGDLRSIDPTTGPSFDTHRPEGLSVTNPVSFGEDACGRVYVVAQAESRVYRLEGPANGACPGMPPLPDTDPPQTTVKLKPRNDRRSRVVAKLSSDEPGSTFECRLDKRDWKDCDAKRKLKGLDSGRHRFRARATDAAGNEDESPAKRKFKTRR
jgi:glucose/arabinose dehydrogenase